MADQPDARRVESTPGSRGRRGSAKHSASNALPDRGKADCAMSDVEQDAQIDSSLGPTTKCPGANETTSLKKKNVGRDVSGSEMPRRKTVLE